ncbi:MAG: DUF3000 family protein [Actinomycetota bacterium]|nr:DUF3000 family protein [Actinomycetota bacterium]
MRSADEPEKRRTARARTSRGLGAVPGRPDAAEVAEVMPDAPPALVDASKKPASQPGPSRPARTSAKKPKTSSTAAKDPGAAGVIPAEAVSTQPVASVPPVRTAVPAARVPGPATPARSSPRPARGSSAAPGSAAEVAFAGVAAAFLAGRDALARRDLQFEDVPAPKRLAPYATAIAATIQRDDADVAWGRLVLLYDPDGQEGWDGFFRLVAYIRAEVEPEIAADPLLGEVGWSWLSEALDAHVPGYSVPSGTVTRVITEGFGAKRDELPLTGFELRASWSPAGPAESGNTGPGHDDLATLDLSAHIAAWCDCLSAAAGLEPPGTRALRQPGYG